MPSDGKFSFSVLIGGRAVPEYEVNGECMIESNLFTPYSFHQRVPEFVNGEDETQEWPVTPYEIQLFLLPGMAASWMNVFVDGVKVAKHVLKEGQNRIVKGFSDDRKTKEFLFSLPRFARDEGDRVAARRKTEIGTIKVQRFAATFLRKEYHDSKSKHHQGIEFSQANKKDAKEITGGDYTMSTTKVGRVIEETTTDHSGMVSIWEVGEQLGELIVHYHMPYTLIEKGVRLVKMDWGVTPTTGTTT